jgi:glycosyltransferase involved in cell wall biosynthesis
MNICFFDHHNTPYPIEKYGGIERINQLLFQVFSENKFNSTLICTDISTIEKTNQYQNIIKLPFHELENIRYGRVPISKYFNGEIFQTHTSSLYHSNFDENGFFGKIVSTCHGFQEFAGNKYQVFISKNQMHQHIRDGLISPDVKCIFVSHECVDSKNLYYDENGSHDKLVWIGRIHRDKGIDRLIQIAGNIDEEILVAAVNHDNFLNEKLKHTKNIKLLGPISEKEKYSFFANAKANIHTSIFEEPFGMTMVEAQMCGIPTISWANGAMLEVNYSIENVFDNLEDIVYCIKNETFKKHNPKEIESWTNQNFSKNNLYLNYKKIYDYVFKD